MTTSYTNYQSLNALEEFSMIAGHDTLLTYNVFQSDGVNPLPLAGTTIKWVLAPFGNNGYTILQKTGTITGINTFTIQLLSGDTSSLFGKYSYQPVITSGTTVYRPTSGSILIGEQIVEI